MKFSGFNTTEKVGIGIGTNVPSRPLEVNGTGNDSVVRVGDGDTDGAAAIAYIEFGANSTSWNRHSYVGSAGADSHLWIVNEENADILFYANNAEKMVIKNDGNVGINTTAPSAILHIRSSGTARNVFYVAASDNSHLAGIYEESDGRGALNVRNAGGTATINLDSGNHSWFTGGNFGIGTTAPNVRFHVETSVADVLSKFINTDGTNGHGLLVKAGGSASGKYIATFRDAANNTRMHLLADGKVGIGTTTPLAKLDIKGDTTTWGGMAKVYLTDTSGHSASRNWSIGNGGTGYGDLNFIVSNALNGVPADSTGTAALVIKNDGKVGIGTIAPDAKLRVYGGDVTLSYSAGSNPFTLRAINDAFWMIGDNAATQEWVMSKTYAHDYAFHFKYTPGTAGAGAGIMTIGQTSKNHANYTHGITAFYTNGLERMRIAANGAIQFNSYGSGTHTGTSAYKLSVDSSGNIIETSIGSGAVDGAGTANYLSKWTDGDTIGNSIIYDDGTNDVGIGVVPTAVNTSHKSLQIGGNVNIQSYGTKGASGEVDYCHNVYLNQDGNYKLISADEATMYRQGSGKHTFYSWASGTAGSNVSANAAATKLIILQDGNVGIGTNAPAALLHVSAGYVNTRKSLILTNSSNTPFSGTTYDSVVINQDDVPCIRMRETGNSANVELTFAVGNEYSNSATIGTTGMFKFATNRTVGQTGYLDQNTRMVILADGNVGIGTTVPAATLHVSKSSNAAVRLTRTSTDGQVLWFYRGSTASGNVTVKSTGLGLGGGTSENSIFIKTDGKVGIGTSSPAVLLDIYESSSGSAWIKLGNSSRPAGMYIGMDAGELQQIYVGGNNPLAFWTNDTERVRITGGGKVGIGTTAPLAKLHVREASAGSFTYDGTADTLIVESNANGGITIATAAANTGRIIFASPNDPTGAEIKYSDATSLMTIGTTTPNDHLVLQAGNGVEAVRVQSDGNVGIGTTNPGGKLEVDGSSVTVPLLVKAGTGANSIKFVGRSGDHISSLDFFQNNGSSGGGFFQSNGTWMRARADGGVHFRNGNTPVTTSSDFTINGMNLGIGITNPDSLLHIEDDYSLTKHLLHVKGGGSSGAYGVLVETANGTDLFKIDTLTYKVTMPSGYPVGIGTTAPDNPLEVVGADSGIKISSASSNRPQLRFECGTAEKMIFSANSAYGAIGDSSDLNRYMAFKDGNVGIGTTAPGHPLVVVTPTGDKGISLTNSSNVELIHMRQEAGDSGAIGLKDGGNVQVWITSRPSSNSYFNVSGANFGIGTNAPAGKLHVQQVASDQSGAAAIKAVGTAYGTNKVIHSYMGTTSATKSLFYAENSNGVVMNIAGSGNVGIGEASPSSKLTVKGAPGNSTYLSYLYNSATHSQAHGLNVQIASSGAAAYGLRVNTGGNTNSLAVMGDGKVGIGTGVPATTLTVAQNASDSGIRLYGYAPHAASYINLRVDSSGHTNFETSGGSYTKFMIGSGYFLLQTAGGEPIYNDFGGTYFWRDVDASNAVRMSLDSSNGNLTVNGALTVSGNVTLGDDPIQDSWQPVGRNVSTQRVIKYFNVTASGTQARSVDVCRLFFNLVHWGTYGDTTVELIDSYYGGSGYLKYKCKAGNGNLLGIELVEASGDTSGMYAEYGAAVDTGAVYAGYANYYVPVKVFVKDYRTVKVIVSTTRSIVAWTNTTGYSKLAFAPSLTYSNVTIGTVTNIAELNPTLSGGNATTPNAVSEMHPTRVNIHTAYVGTTSAGTQILDSSRAMTNIASLAINSTTAGIYNLMVSGDANISSSLNLGGALTGTKATFSGTGSGATSLLYLNTTNDASIGFRVSGQAADNRLWDFRVNGLNLIGRTLNDAQTQGVSWLHVARSGNTIASASLQAGSGSMTVTPAGVAVAGALTGTTATFNSPAGTGVALAVKGGNNLVDNILLNLINQSGTTVLNVRNNGALYGTAATFSGALTGTSATFSGALTAGRTYVRRELDLYNTTGGGILRFFSDDNVSISKLSNESSPYKGYFTSYAGYTPSGAELLFRGIDGICLAASRNGAVIGLRMNEDGAVGIGCTDPKNKFQVQVGTDHRIGFWGTSTYSAIQSVNDANTALKAFRFDASSYSFYGGTATVSRTSNDATFIVTRTDQTNIRLIAAGSSYLRGSAAVHLQTNGASSTVTAISMLTNGNVGIGTTVPAATLHVRDTTASTGRWTAAFVADNAAIVSAQTHDHVLIQSNDVPSLKFYEYGQDQVGGIAVGDNNTTLSTTEAMRFYVNGSATGPLHDGLNGTCALKLQTNGTSDFYGSVTLANDKILAIGTGAGNSGSIRIFDNSSTSRFMEWEPVGTSDAYFRFNGGTSYASPYRTYFNQQHPSGGHNVYVDGDITSMGTGRYIYAVNLNVTGYKNFEIEHPTKEDMMLVHSSLEGPEAGVYYRGRAQSNTITLPDYWTGLVRDGTITVQLTPNGSFQHLYVVSTSLSEIKIGAAEGETIDCYYIIYGERADVAPLVVEDAAAWERFQERKSAMSDGKA